MFNGLKLHVVSTITADFSWFLRFLCKMYFSLCLCAFGRVNQRERISLLKSFDMYRYHLAKAF